MNALNLVTLVIALQCYTLTSYTPDLTKLFPENELRPIIIKNRATLSMVPQWIDDDTYKNAFYWYGLPESVRHLIDMPMSNEITYSDAIVYLTKFLEKDIHYLELGTSFGKNFLQVAHAVANSTLVGYDIENISPIMESILTNKTVLDEWSTPCILGEGPWNSTYHTLKKGNSSLSLYSQKTNNNTVLYLSGDVLDEQSWQRLQGRKFNLIFSDACHDPKALLYEYKMLEKYDLIDSNEFIFIWDDLGGAMTDAFMQIFDILRTKNQLQEYQGFVVQLRGWLGTHIHHHNIGIIMHTKTLPPIK